MPTTQEQMNLIISAVDNTKAAVNSAVNSFKWLGTSVTQISTQFTMITEAARRAFAVMEKGFNEVRDAVDGYNMAVIKAAALVTGMMAKDDRPLAKRYAEAKDYAEGLAIALEDIDKRTLLTAQDLQGITEEMAKQGVLLDFNNQKQVKGFEALANALAVISAGSPNKAIQLRQEARALLQGEVNVNSQLAMILQSQVGNLESQVALHKRQGDLLEWLGEQLVGFTAASGDISATWEAIQTSLETIYRQVLRGGLGPAFKEIVELVKKLSDWVTDHKNQIQTLLVGAWQSVRGVIETVGNLFAGFKGDLGPIKDLTVTILEGWRAIATVYLPPLAGLVNAIVRPLWDMLRTLGNIGRVAALIIAGDFSAADKAFGDMKASWEDWKKSSENVVSGKALDSYMDEFSRRLVEYERAWEPGKTKGAATVPGTSRAKTDKEKAEAQAATEAWLKNEITAIKRREVEAIASLKIQEAEAEKNQKSGLISELELAAEKRRISEQEGQAHILAVDMEIAAQKKLLAMKAGNYKDSKEQIKEEAAIRAEVVKLETERNKIVSEGKVKGLKFDIEEIEQAKKDFENWLNLQHDIEKYTKEQASRIKAIREGEINEQLAELDIAEKLGKAHRETVDERIRLEKERLAIQEKALESINKEKDPAGWYAQKNAIDSVRKSLADLYREQLMNNPFEAMKLAMKDVENEWTDTGKQMYNQAKETAQSMQSAFSDFFFDAMDLKLKSLADYVRSFLTGVQKAIAQTLGQQVTGAAISGIGDLASLITWAGPGSGFHTGGRVGGPASFYRLVPAAALTDLLPRRHGGGLAPDERLVINRVGERYVTEEQNSWLTGIAKGMARGTNESEQSVVYAPITINAVDAKSFEELCRRNPQAVVSPVMQSMRDNRTRKEMKSLLK